MFSIEHGKKLIELARLSLESYFSKRASDTEEYRVFSSKQGVFVTLTKEGELRGCIGFPEPTYPLYKAVFEAARSAALHDPRFPPLREDELKDVDIEVSVLTVPELIKTEKPEDYMKSIIIGQDGLIIRHGPYSGLLLPQVPVEWGWDVKEFLSHICIKAGLSQDAWKDISSRLYKFNAQIFSEESGKIIEKDLLS